jgi:hypothetical protein
MIRSRYGRLTLLAWSGPLVGATFLAGLAGGIARSSQPYPRPGATADDIDRYLRQPSKAPWISISGQLFSAASLVAWTTHVARLGQEPQRASRPPPSAEPSAQARSPPLPLAPRPSQADPLPRAEPYACTVRPSCPAARPTAPAG